MQNWHFAWHCMYCNIFLNFLDQCETDRKTNGTLLKTGGETLKERKPLSKIDRHSCRRLRRFLILESCNAYISSICSICIRIWIHTSEPSPPSSLLAGLNEPRRLPGFEAGLSSWKNYGITHEHHIDTSLSSSRSSSLTAVMPLAGGLLGGLKQT